MTSALPFVEKLVPGIPFHDEAVGISCARLAPTSTVGHEPDLQTPKRFLSRNNADELSLLDDRQEPFRLSEKHEDLQRFLIG